MLAIYLNMFSGCNEHVVKLFLGDIHILAANYFVIKRIRLVFYISTNPVEQLRMVSLTLSMFLLFSLRDFNRFFEKNYIYI